MEIIHIGLGVRGRHCLTLSRENTMSSVGQ